MRFDAISARRDRVEEAHRDTGKWLEEDVEYTDWNHSNRSSLLLLRGKPGSGKSTLAKSILKSLNKDTAAKNDVLIADFFYSFRGGQKETSHTLMLQSLLYQLLSQDERLFPLFREAYRSKKKELPFKWHREDLMKIFASLSSLKTCHTVYILLDAMDESNENGRPQILKLLLVLCSSKSDCKFKCLIASRPLPAGEIDKGSCCHLIILQEKNRKDIENLITSGLRDIEARPGGSLLDFRFASEYMMQHAHGVFLWVAIVLEELKRLVSAGPSQEELDTRLKELPLELEDMYSLIIRRLVDKQKPPFGDMVEKGVKMLTWVAFAGRPLKTAEFGDAIAIPSIPKPFCPEPNFLARARIPALDLRIEICCGPLLEIQESVIQLLHVTVREFLLRADKPAKPFDTDEERGDTEIASCCIRYLRVLSARTSTEEVGRWSPTRYNEFVVWLSGHPLLDYVVSFLPGHMEMLPKDSPVFSELSLFLQVLRKDNAISCLFESWVNLLGTPSENQRPGIEPGQFRVKCLVSAAQHGYLEVVKSVAKLRTKIDEIDRESGVFALLAAVNEGHEAVARLLLEMGANVQANDKNGRTPLWWAAAKGNETMVQLLLEKRADVEATDSISLTPLSSAAAEGHEAVVRLLIENGANVEASDIIGRTTLSLAAERGHEAVVRLLLEEGANVEYSQMALSLAAENGHEAVVRLLIEKGADVQAKDKDGRIPL